MNVWAVYLGVIISGFSLVTANLPDPYPDEPRPEQGQAGVALVSTASAMTSGAVPELVANVEIEIPPPAPQFKIATDVRGGSGT